MDKGVGECAYLSDTKKHSFYRFYGSWKNHHRKDDR